MTLFGRHVSRSIQFVALLCCLSASMLASQQSRGASSPLRVTFLGTGSPAVSVERFSPCILVEAGPQKFIFDAGRGCVLRLQQARIVVPTLTGVFVTHLHSDHVLSIPDLFLTRWTQRNESPFRVWGPSGTQAMMSHVVAAYEFDINARVKNGRRRPELAVQDVSGATEAQVMAITRENYAGRVELATDLSVVDIGSEITFERGR